MMRRTTRRTNRQFFDKLLQNWVTIVVAMLAIPYLYKYMMSVYRKQKEMSNDEQMSYIDSIKDNAPAQDEYLADKSTHKERKIAREIYHHLGLAYDWYDPRRWTENDEDIYNLLKDYHPVPKGIYNAYFVISNGRDLKADLNRLLDVQYLELLDL